ncbi:MAG: hypothetical protein E6R03_16130 [Hyphomicrobiaceae bacterium]|nr:MAG: hypothetical protein E6R03_16130 [Hyphomicrobiaceae bacterium]
MAGTYETGKALAASVGVPLGLMLLAVSLLKLIPWLLALILYLSLFSAAAKLIMALESRPYAPRAGAACNPVVSAKPVVVKRPQAPKTPWLTIVDE